MKTLGVGGGYPLLRVFLINTLDVVPRHFGDVTNESHNYGCVDIPQSVTA